LQAKNYISSYCVIENNSIAVNGEKQFEIDNGSFSEFAKAAYKKFEIDYPKFFKMDNLSKLAFLTSEIILKEAVQSDSEIDMTLVFPNK